MDGLIPDELDVGVRLALRASDEGDNLGQVILCICLRNLCAKISEFLNETRDLSLVEDCVAVGIDEADAERTGEIG